MSERIGCVVLSHHPGDAIVATIAAVCASARPADELLIIDNASPEISLAALRAAYPNLAVEARSTNDGYGSAMNTAARQLIDHGCTTLLFLTQETVVEPTAIGQLSAELAGNDSVGVVGPTLCWRSDPTRVWSTGGWIGSIRSRPRHTAADAGGRQGDQDPIDVDWLDGACLMMPSAVFQQVGGFRDDLFLYWEDVDICRRVRELGRVVRCVRAAVAYQEPGMTPPYLAARNRALVLGRSAWVGAVIDIGVHATADVLRRRGLRRAALELRGLRDARAGTLDRSIALERPQ